MCIPIAFTMRWNEFHLLDCIYGYLWHCSRPTGLGEAGASENHLIFVEWKGTMGMGGKQTDG